MDPDFGVPIARPTIIVDERLYKSRAFPPKRRAQLPEQPKHPGIPVQWLSRRTITSSKYVVLYHPCVLHRHHRDHAKASGPTLPHDYVHLLITAR